MPGHRVTFPEDLILKMEALMGRADRRHHTERVKARFYRKQRLNPLGSTSKSAAGLYANHGCNCSCPMCGNPRRHFGEPTMQERRFSVVPMDAIERGLYDGDADSPCVWHCTDDDPDAPCGAL